VVTAEDASTPTDSSSGSDTSTTPPDSHVVLPDGATFDYCKAVSERATKCGTGYDPVRCARDQGCFTRAIKPDDGNAYLVCVATRDCGTSEDSCLSAVAAKYTTDPTAQAYSKACFDRRATCTADTAYADDLCGIYHGMLLPDILAKLKACFDKPCADAKICYESIVAGYGCK